MLRYFIIIIGAIASFLIIGALLLFGAFFAPPKYFPVDQIIVIESGQSLKNISLTLYQQKAIRSPLVFTTVTKWFAGEDRVIAGYYQFEEALDVFQLARRFIDGDFTLAPVKVTLPEGLSVAQMAKIFSRAPLLEFDPDVFIEMGLSKQGYLFPSTYLFPSRIKVEQILDLMNKNFQRQIADLQGQITDSGRSLEEVLVMSSIVEKEASDYETRRMIAGILWKRLDEGWKLEVDVARETYENYGLPERPIVSPGLKAIMATLDPVPNEFWFFLSDNTGQTHYARNYPDHKKNIDQYLRNSIMPQA